MNKEIMKLLENIKVLVKNNVLEENLKAIADETTEDDMTIHDLNDILQCEISYFGKESE